MSAAVLYVTFPNREAALDVARALVGERLIACANVLAEATSVYRWNDAIEQEAEVVLFAKTRATLVEATIARVRELHSYDCPCITSWPIEAGDPDYLAWIAAETVAATGLPLSRGTIPR